MNYSCETEFILLLIVLSLMVGAWLRCKGTWERCCLVNDLNHVNVCIEAPGLGRVCRLPLIGTLNSKKIFCHIIFIYMFLHSCISLFAHNLQNIHLSWPISSIWRCIKMSRLSRILRISRLYITNQIHEIYNS